MPIPIFTISGEMTALRFTSGLLPRRTAQVMSKFLLALPAVLFLLLTSCIPVDQHALYQHSTIYSFLGTNPKPLPNGGLVSDADILNYANSLAMALWAKSENQGVSSDTMTALFQSLALIASSSGVLGIAESDALIVTFAGSTLPIFQDLFKMKGKSVAFRQAYVKVMEYKAAYQDATLAVLATEDPTRIRSKNGLILLSKTEAVMTELLAAVNGELVPKSVQQASNQEMVEGKENVYMRLDRADGLLSAANGAFIPKQDPKNFPKDPPPQEIRPVDLQKWLQEQRSKIIVLDEAVGTLALTKLKPENSNLTDEDWVKEVKNAKSVPDSKSALVAMAHERATKMEDDKLVPNPEGMKEFETALKNASEEYVKSTTSTAEENP